MYFARNCWNIYTQTFIIFKAKERESDPQCFRGVAVSLHSSRGPVSHSRAGTWLRHRHDIFSWSFLVFFSSCPSNRKFIASPQLVMWFTFECLGSQACCWFYCLAGTDFWSEASVFPADRKRNPPAPISKIARFMAQRHFLGQLK